MINTLQVSQYILEVCMALFPESPPLNVFFSNFDEYMTMFIIGITLDPNILYEQFDVTLADIYKDLIVYLSFISKFKTIERIGNIPVAVYIILFRHMSDGNTLFR